MTGQSSSRRPAAAGWGRGSVGPSIAPAARLVLCTMSAVAALQPCSRAFFVRNEEPHNGVRGAHNGVRRLCVSARAQVMATCMAYFKVSSRRFRDAVPMLVRHHLVHAVALSFDEHMLRCARARTPPAGMPVVSAAGGAATRLIFTLRQGCQCATLAGPASLRRSLEAYAASASSHHGGVGSAHGAGGTAPPPASLGWAGSPAVLSLMAGGPLDAAQLARRGELEAERAALGGILARLNAMLEPLA